MIYKINSISVLLICKYNSFCWNNKNNKFELFCFIFKTNTKLGLLGLSQKLYERHCIWNERVDQVVFTDSDLLSLKCSISYVKRILMFNAIYKPFWTQQSRYALLRVQLQENIIFILQWLKDWHLHLLSYNLFLVMDPRFAGSNPAGVDGFFQSVKSWV